MNAIIKLIGYPDFIKNDRELDNYYADVSISNWLYIGYKEVLIFTLVAISS